MATKILLVVAIVALQLLVTSAQQAPDGVTFFGFNVTSFRQYDHLGAFVSQVSLTCVNYAYVTTLGGDGNIWWSAGNALKYVDPQTYECDQVTIGSSQISNAFASPSGAFIYFLQDGSIYRYNLRSKETELVLQKVNTYNYLAFGFVGSDLVAARQGLPMNITVEFYSVNGNDDLVLPLRTSVITNGPNNFPLMGVKTGLEGQVYRFQASLGLASIIGTTFNSIVSTTAVNMQIIYDLWTAPWSVMYFVTSHPRLYTKTASSLTIAQNYTVFTGTSTLLALIEAPTLSISSDCQASVQFNTYNWTSKYTVQVQNPLTGLFENDRVQAAPTEGSQNVQLTALCNGASMRVRVRLDGAASSDPIFSFPQAINCTCQAPVPNVQPILECIEQTGNGLVVHLGYNNAESYVAQLAVGPNNRFSDVDNRNQPTSFAVGRSNFYPDSAFKFAYSGNATWFLSTYTLNFDTSATSVYCPSNVSFVLSFTSSTDVTQSDIDNIRDGIVNLLNITSSRVNVVNVTSTPVTKKRATNIVQITFEISADRSGNELSAAESVRVIANLPTPTLTQIINGGNNNNGRTVQSVSTVPSGTEQQGQQAAPSAVPQSDNAPTGTPSVAPTKNSTPKSALSSATVTAPAMLLLLANSLVALIH